MFNGYIEGDKWGIRDLLLRPNYAVHFKSKKQWLKKVCLVSLEIGAFCFAIIFIFSFLSPDRLEPLIIIALAMIPTLLVSIALGIISYIQSFIQYDKLDDKVSQLFPEVEKNKRIDGNNWVLTIQGHEFQLLYQERVNQSINKHTFHAKKKIILILNFGALADFPSPYKDEGGFNDDFIHDWNVFAHNKEPFRYIGISPNVIFALFDSWDTPKEVIKDVVDMMIYLPKRFHLQPLTLEQLQYIIQKTNEQRQER